MGHPGGRAWLRGILEGQYVSCVPVTATHPSIQPSLHRALLMSPTFLESATSGSGLHGNGAMERRRGSRSTKAGQPGPAMKSPSKV